MKILKDMELMVTFLTNDRQELFLDRLNMGQPDIRT